MKPAVAIFAHSLVSDWNHGNAHFLRGIVTELLSRGHKVRFFEPENGWSLANLLADHGPGAIQEFQAAYPTLRSETYSLDQLDLDRCLVSTDLVLVHEWNDPLLVQAVGRYRRTHPHIRAFFHDTHHRAITAPDELARFDLSAFDGVLAYGKSLQSAYDRLGWGRQVYVWHEAADTRIFHPVSSQSKRADLVWIGNWGDDERTSELEEFLLAPCRDLSLAAEAYGVRYPQAALDHLASAAITYRGYLPNYRVPEVFAQFRVTVHVPRRPYLNALAGIPTIRPFEALACGIPLVCAPWRDEEGLFRPGVDFLMAHNGEQMRRRLRDVLHDPDLSHSLIQNGLQTIRTRHTCAHRVDELLAIYQQSASKSLTRDEVFQ